MAVNDGCHFFLDPTTDFLLLYNGNQASKINPRLSVVSDNTFRDSGLLTAYNTIIINYIFAVDI